tara:strand:- start:451 stop:1449 length:999 start_codon:yes stop_codon:yes gene_type:complete
MEEELGQQPIKHPNAGENAIEQADTIFEQSYANNAKAINEVGGSLNKEFFDIMQEDVENGQAEFYEAVQSGDKGAKAKAMMKLNQKSSNVANFKETWKMIGESAVDNSLSKGMTSDDKFTLAYVTDTNNKPTVTEEGFVWENVEMPDGTVKNINQADMNNAMVLRDDKTSKELIDLSSQAAASGKEGQAFDFDRNIATVKKLIKPENLRSLMFDDTLNNNSSFIEEIREAFLQPESLKQMLGPMAGSIDGPLEEGESNWLDNISEADSKLIEDAITNPKNSFYNEEFSKEILADYFTRKSQMEHSKTQPQSEAEEDPYGGMSALDLVQKYSK